MKKPSFSTTFRLYFSATCVKIWFISIILLTYVLNFFGLLIPITKNQTASRSFEVVVDEIQARRQNQIRETCAKLNDITSDPSNGVLKTIDWENEIKFMTTHTSDTVKSQRGWLYIVRRIPVNYCKYVFFF